MHSVFSLDPAPVFLFDLFLYFTAILCVHIRIGISDVFIMVYFAFGDSEVDVFFVFFIRLIST